MESKFIDVQDYYGKRLTTSEDLQTNACCTAEKPPKHILNALKNVHEEVKSKYYGCGITLPSEVKGMTILDLGSGSGRDCYIASQLVGSEGSVIGVDMTDEQLAVANKYIDHHADVFGYHNVRFIKGNIESLDELGLEEESIDIIISNCVINLVPNKDKVLKDAYRLLKKGGEMYFSDVYADRRIPKELQDDKVLWGECLSGALYWNDFENFAKKAGFGDPRLFSVEPITIQNEIVEQQVGDIKFFSMNYRLWKIDELESHCEDYGQAVMYEGTVNEEPNSLTLDNHHIFPKGKISSVCGNTYLMLHESRFKNHFEFYGDFSTHFGIFKDCGIEAPFDSITYDEDSGSGGCC